MNDTWVSTLSGLVGAIIGGAASIIAASITVKNGEALKKEEDKQVRIRKFTAIKCEFEYLLERYLFVYDSIISQTKDNQPINELAISRSEYFIIYKNNSSCIGDISSKILQENIIKTYITANAIIEEFDTNNGIIREIEEKEKLLSLNPIHTQYIDKAQLNAELLLLRRQLSDYGNNIRKDNTNLIEYAKKSIEGLNKELENIKIKK